MAPNKVQFWGATLFDFFYVRRIPDCPYLSTISSGSKLAAWMKEQGEHYARDQMARAEREPDPVVVRPYPVERLLRDAEAAQAKESKGKAKEEPKVLWFGRDIPFSETGAAPILQEMLPLHLLPKTLLVHDPFKTLSTVRSHDHPPNWEDKPDAVSTYRLELSDEGKNKVEVERKAAGFATFFSSFGCEEFLRNPTAEGRPLERGMLFIPQGTKTGPCAPAVYFMHERRPSRDTVPEAHLYITPHQLTGTGHHSVVYDVEWELPRHVLVDDVICKKCVFEKGMAILEAEDGVDGERKDPKWLEKTGRVVETVKQHPGFTLIPFDAEGESIRDLDGEISSYDIDPPQRIVTRKYHGPVRIIDTQVAWQNADLAPLCEHLLADGRRQNESLTVKVKVVAKMSLEKDAHLEREAKNYQEFPKHFFEHWSGYNILPPLHDPVPVGALVPQFYGYYVPDGDVPVRVWDRDKDGKVELTKEPAKEDGKEAEGVDVKQGEPGSGEAADTVAVETDKAQGEEGKSKVDAAEGELKPEAGDESPAASVLNEYDSGEDEGLTKEQLERLKNDPEYYNYRSPLLLIESCGTPICDTMEGMTIDDSRPSPFLHRQHCASLFMRMHHEGWVHQSTYTRNVLHQPGLLSDAPEIRQKNAEEKRADLRKTSFRLIDFGRSYKYDNAGERASEEMDVTKTFRILHMDG
ncbi:hypothetical protein NMY22_g11302 [Coprinellus aureogranulatus]|nr:hypothetical protein NMY22_g11302 [Coprinellus aureogranulatus]